MTNTFEHEIVKGQRYGKPHFDIYLQKYLYPFIGNWKFEFPNLLKSYNSEDIKMGFAGYFE